jgi:hypothetical protein
MAGDSLASGANRAQFGSKKSLTEKQWQERVDSPVLPATKFAEPPEPKWGRCKCGAGFDTAKEFTAHAATCDGKPVKMTCPNCGFSE